MAIRKRGLTVEHGALLACGIKSIRRIDDLDYWLSKNHHQKLVDVGEGHSLACIYDNKFDIANWFSDLVELLQEELQLVEEWSRYNSTPELCQKPQRQSPIEMIKLSLYPVFGQYPERRAACIDFNSSLMTYDSLAQWFVGHDELEMGKRILRAATSYYGTGGPQLANVRDGGVNAPLASQSHQLTPSIQTSSKIDFETDDIPTNLYLAYSVFKEVWRDIPQNMRNPTKPQLVEYLITKGVNVAADIDAIIRLAKPDNVKFGGHGDATKRPWKPKHQR